MDSDADETSGGTAKDNAGAEIKGIDSIQTIQRNRGEQLEIKENKTGDGTDVSTVYNILDAHGRVVASYTNNDHNDTTGETLKVMVDGKEIELKGIDSFETYEYNANGQLTEIQRNLNATGNAEEKIYIERDATGRELGRYTDLDNNENTGTGNAGQDAAIRLADGRVLKGVDRFETYKNDEKGNRIEIDRNLDAKGGFEEIEYRDVDQSNGQVKGVYYNRDNDSKDNAPLPEKTGKSIILGDGREIVGIDNYTTYVRDNQNRVIEERFNLDATGENDRVYYYDLDANGNRVGEYQNLDNDTTKTLDGKDQITGTTHTLADGRQVTGIERFYTREFDGNNRVIKQESNLDGKAHAESVSYYVRDALGREVARYENTNNDVLSNGNPNPTGHSHTITLDGKEVTVTGIDRIVKNEHNAYGNVTKVQTNNTGEAGDDKFTQTTTNVYNERRQKVEDESTVKLASGETVKSAANKYTYDTYGRQVTRGFDTDFSKEGVERVETYHYNSLNQLVRTDRDIVDQGGDIDGYTTYERNVFGQEIVNKTYSNAAGDLEGHYDTVRDVYGNIARTTIYGTDGQITRVNNYTRDARGLEIKNQVDWNGDGVYNGLDTIIISNRDDTPQGNIVSQLQSYADGRPEVYTVWRYDELGRRNFTHVDTNQNNKVDDGERNTQISFVADTSLIDVNAVYSGTGLVYLQKLHYSSNNQILGGFYSDAHKVYHTLSYNGYGGTGRSSTEDFTESHYEALFKQVGGTIKTLNMSDANYKTEITLDNDVLAKLTKSELLINGEATDTIRLKDNTEFKQLENVTRGRQEYEQYQTEVDGQQYTLLIDTDINVVLA